MSQVEGEPLLRAVPEALKRLVRLIVRGFYSMEHALVVDMLVRHPCVKEDDIAELLKFERKHLRSILNLLKTDKFLKCRMRVETDHEEHTTRHTYYFINYSVFVNVVKYKLDHMRRKIETDERDNTSRSSFKCPGCDKTYTDYEVGQLLDPMTQELICTFCLSKVEEDESSIPKQDARTLLARFNEQIQPIYELLKNCEDVRLAPELLDPEPTDMKKAMSRANSTSSKGNKDMDKSSWSGYATRNVGFGYTENTVTITMDEDSSSRVEKKDQPVWMVNSTVEGVAAMDATLGQEKQPEVEKRSRGNANEDILQTLLVHEPQAGTARLPVLNQSDGESDGDEAKNGNDVEEMDSDDDEDEGPMVSIGSKRVPYNSVTYDLVATMTPLEKEEYIRIGQKLFEMYE